MIKDPVLNGFFTQYWLEHDRQNSFMYFENLEENLESVISLLISEFLHDQTFSQAMVESLLTVLLAILLRNYKKGHPEHKDKQVVEIYDYLYKNYATADLQSTVAHFHFYKVFREKYMMSPAQYRVMNTQPSS